MRTPRLTRRELQNKVDQLSSLIGDKLVIDQAYGGYKLYKCVPNSSGVSDFIYSARISLSEMYRTVSAIVDVVYHLKGKEEA